MSEKHPIRQQEPWNDLPLDRREFLKVIGGIFVFFTLEEPAAGGERPPQDFNAFLRIGEDGRVSCFTGKIEMGQGIVTSLAQMLAEELDVPLSSVDMVMGDTDLCPWDMGTFGSMSTRFFGPPMRGAAAQARAVLLQLAAAQLGAPEDRLTVKDGVVSDKEHPDKTVSYAALTKGKRIEKRLEGKATPKPYSSFTVSGKPTLRTDGAQKVMGRAKYAADIREPGMLCARILRPPAHDARLKSADTSAAEKVEGVRVIREDDLVAVLHPLPDVAEKALKLVKAEFETPEAKVDDSNLHEHLMRNAPREQVVEQSGDLEAGKKLAAVSFDNTYFDPYVAHAPIEPHAALAKVEGGKVTVWASTQRPFGARDEVAKALGIPGRDVRIITPFVGGGFGGKVRNIQVVEAARLAKIAGKPVQVAWTREEEFFLDTFRPASVIKISSGLDASNRIVFWDYHVYYAGDRSARAPYDIPHRRTASHGGWSNPAQMFETGAWRAPGSNSNVFARESQIDIMAARAGLDPLAFRLAHLKDARLRRVLEEAARRFGWVAAKAPSGRGHGIACEDYGGTCVAAMAEVNVDRKTGAVQVKRIACAQDMGQVVNPEGARMQVEGCLMMGLGYSLTEEVHFKGRAVLDRNFDTYEIPRFSWMPRIEAALVESPEVPPQGGGEPAIPCAGAVVASAIFDAVGARLFQVPMTSERVLKAIEAAPKQG